MLRLTNKKLWSATIIHVLNRYNAYKKYGLEEFSKLNAMLNSLVAFIYFSVIHLLACFLFFFRFFLPFLSKIIQKNILVFQLLSEHVCELTPVFWIKNPSSLSLILHLKCFFVVSSWHCYLVFQISLVVYLKETFPHPPTNTICFL